MHQPHFKVIQEIGRSPRTVLNMSALVTLVALSGCAGWDEEVAAPEDFRSTYIELHSCKSSSHPKAEYVITYLSPQGRETWEAYRDGEMGGDFPVGTVSVKAQYSDSTCSTLTGYTLMETVSTDSSGALGGWRWQYTNEDGVCNNCDSGTECSSCHSPCTNGPAYFCTTPTPE